MRERLVNGQDVFLRELVSNAADACDKKRFLALTDPGTAGSGCVGLSRASVYSGCYTSPAKESGLTPCTTSLRHEDPEFR